MSSLDELERRLRQDPDNRDIFLRLIKEATRQRNTRYFVSWVAYLYDQRSKNWTATINSDAHGVFQLPLFEMIDQPGGGHNESVFVLTKCEGAIGGADTLFRQADGEWVSDWRMKDTKPPKGFKKTIFNETNLYWKPQHADLERILKDASKDFGIPVDLGKDLIRKSEVRVRETSGGRFDEILNYNLEEEIKCKIEVWADPKTIPRQWLEGHPRAEYEKLRFGPFQELRQNFPEIIVDHKINNSDCVNLVSYVSIEDYNIDDDDSLRNEWLNFYRYYDLKDYEPYLIGVGSGFMTTFFVVYTAGFNNEYMATQIAMERWPDFFEEGEEIRIVARAEAVWPARQITGDTYQLLNGEEVTLGCYD